MHSEAKYSVQHVAAESGFVDKANCAMASLCLYFSKPKGQNYCIDTPPPVLKLLLHSLCPFLTFFFFPVSGEFVI